MPVVMISGDDAAVEEAHRLIGPTHTVSFTGSDILEVARFLTFVGAFEAGLTP